jgi:hypothetical protein
MIKIQMLYKILKQKMCKRMTDIDGWRGIYKECVCEREKKMKCHIRRMERLIKK